MRLLHEIAIFQTVKSKVIISLFETVKLSVSISLRNLYNSLNSIFLKKLVLQHISTKRLYCAESATKTTSILWDTDLKKVIRVRAAKNPVSELMNGV